MLKAFRRTFSKTSFVKAKPKLVDKNFALKNFIGPLIALVGRPNVGKSSLFNRLAGKEVAIVHKTAGVTRDRKLGQGYLSDLKFIMVDTPGFCELSHKEKQDLKNVRNAMVRQSELALKNAQMALFVVDSSDGLTADDYSFCKWLRSQNLNKNLKNNIILVANKADGKNKNSFADDVYSLEMGEPTYVSAKHNEGMADLYKTLQPKIDKINQSEKIYNIVDAFDLNKFSQMAKEKDPLLKSDKNKSLQFAIIGRPNVGKSTLANAILKNSDISEQRTEFSREDRVVTSPVPGTTRDSISINLVFRNRFFKLIDTAGLVGPGRMSWKSLEREVSASMDDTLKSVQFANVVCLVLNIGENTIAQLRKIEKISKNDIAKAIFSKKDHSIANKILEEGRSLLLAINKIDKIPNLKKIPTAEKIVKQTKDFVVEKMKSFAGRIDVVGISAKQNLNICQLLDNAIRIHEKWNERISTSKINKWINEIFRFQPPPSKDGKPIKIRFVTQVKTRPPTFAVFSSKEVPTNYQKFLTSKIHEEFEFNGVPVRLLFRIKDNPFRTKENKRIAGNKGVVVSAPLKRK